MSKKNKKRFRVGQRVQLASDPARTFVIAKSRVPERIYFERGTKTWYTRNELQSFGAPENPATSFRLNGKGNACTMRANACATTPGRRCLECGAPFQPTREWQRFDRPACRYAYRRRVRSSRAKKAHGGLSLVAG